MEAYQSTIGDTKHLSFYDLKAVNLMYKCEKLCSNQLVCQQNGFINSKTCDSCWCPDGFTGRSCEKIMTPVGRRPCGGKFKIQSQYSAIGTRGWPHWPDEELEKGQECTWLLKFTAGFADTSPQADPSIPRLTK
uniref:Uncharacterized protein n=1 Tax=Romanomermis culicivorax TaxID=13658 RepID=A0A915L666_ROMCU